MGVDEPTGFVPKFIPDDIISAAIDLILAIGDHTRSIIKDSGESGDSAEVEAIINQVSSHKKSITANAMALKKQKAFLNN